MEVVGVVLEPIPIPNALLPVLVVRVLPNPVVAAAPNPNDVFAEDPNIDDVDMGGILIVDDDDDCDDDCDAPNPENPTELPKILVKGFLTSSSF